MPPPPQFDTLEMVFHIIDDEDKVHEIEMEVELARFNYMIQQDDPFSFVPINKAGREVAKELVVYKIPTKERSIDTSFKLVYKKDM